MAYRSDVDALSARADALAEEVRAKSRELESTRALLDDAKARARLPVLPNIGVATPCSADWNAMSGDDRVRACAACNKNVYNLSSLTREQAEALIVEKERKLCVRYFQRKDGTILLKDCSVGIRQKRKRRVLAAGVAALLGGSVFGAIQIHRQHEEEAEAAREHRDAHEIMGGFSLENREHLVREQERLIEQIEGTGPATSPPQRPLSDL